MNSNRNWDADGRADQHDVAAGRPFLAPLGADARS